MKKKSLAHVLICAFVLLLTANTAVAQETPIKKKIKNALSAAPASISMNATVMDWPAEDGKMAVLKEGTNDYTCLPDIPQTTGNDPMCIDEAWMTWADAWMNKKDFKIDKMGFGYMLRGGSPESNTDPYAEGPTDDNQWMEEGMPHLMIIAPDESYFDGLPRTPESGAPWVMWSGTPYAHVMVVMPEHKGNH